LAKEVSLLIKIFFVPIITVIYAGCKITKKPYYINIFNSKYAKIKLLTKEETTRLTAAGNVSAFSEQIAGQGFLHLFDYEDLSLTTKSLFRLFVNKPEKIYCTAKLDAKGHTVLAVSFFAAVKNQQIIIGSNYIANLTPAPPGVVELNHPEMRALDLYAEIKQKIHETGKQLVLIRPGTLMRLSQQLRLYRIKEGLKSGYLTIKSKEEQSSACYYHNMIPAETSCSACQTALCAGCKKEYQEKTYCPNCLPERKEQTDASQISALPDGFGFASFAIRVWAAIVDVLLILGISGGIIYVLAIALGLILSPEASFKATGFLGQLFFISFTLCYLCWPLIKFSKTPGQALFGLRAVDGRMQPISPASVFVRTGYHLLTVLFILPFLGYFTALFHKKKQGVQDKISGTFIITRRHAQKALISWIFIALLGATGMGFVVKAGISPFSFDSISLIARLFFNPPQPEISLTPLWQEDLQEPVYTALKRGDKLLLAEGSSIKALSIKSGQLLWQYQCTLPPIFSSEAKKEQEFLFVIDSPAPDQYQLKSLFFNDGSLRWSQTLQLDQVSGLFQQDDLLFTYSATSLSTFTTDGQLLWTRTFPAGDIAVVSCHSDQKGVLVDVRDYQSEIAVQYYLATEDGKIIWQRDLTFYHDSTPIADNYLYEQDTSANTAALLQLDTRQVIWKRPEESPYVLDHVVTKNKETDTIPDGVLYFRSKALMIKNGEIAFDYPKDTRFIGKTSELLLLETATPPEQQNTLPDRELLLLDRETGRTVLPSISLGSRTVTLLEEQGTNLFFNMIKLQPEDKYFTAKNSLLIVDTNTGTSQHIELGENLSGAMVFPSRDHIVIVEENTAGSYALPPPSVQR
jgi:uncharacterized RDD family membrane protein YckC